MSSSSAATSSYLKKYGLINYNLNTTPAKGWISPFVLSQLSLKRSGQLAKIAAMDFSKTNGSFDSIPTGALKSVLKVELQGPEIKVKGVKSVVVKAKQTKRRSNASVRKQGNLHFVSYFF